MYGQSILYNILVSNVIGVTFIQKDGSEVQLYWDGYYFNVKNPETSYHQKFDELSLALEVIKKQTS